MRAGVLIAPNFAIGAMLSTGITYAGCGETQHRGNTFRGSTAREDPLTHTGA